MTRSSALRILLVAMCLALLGVARAPSTTASGGPVELRVLHLVDTSRTIRLPDGHHVARPVTTFVRFPTSGRRPWPLIVFGHGFAATPGIYAKLLDAWARAGYVVAAPLFPLGNAHAPGGPNESDIVNQPRDMSFVISRLLEASASRTGVFSGLIDPARIAVAGQSDGGVTAFAAAYDPDYRDRRIDAVVILSAAPVLGAWFRFPHPGPPLIVTQGTADTINPASHTYAFYAAAPRPKFMLTLRGAEHVPPYTTEEPQLGIVASVTTAFLDHYLKADPLVRIARAAHDPGVAALVQSP